MEVTYSPVLSPKILKDDEYPKTSEDLIKLTLIHQYDYSEWAAWMSLKGDSELDVENGIIIVDSNVALQAAIDGAGVALGSFPFVAPELASGSLIKPFDIDLVPSRSYYVLVKPQITPNPDISIFVEWLKSQVSN
jgi:LysR family glycine cleavage system transcriptional activator